MTQKRNDVDKALDPLETSLNARQLRAFQHGLGARIMPVADGWKIDFFSVPDFEQEPGTTFSRLQEAVQTILEWLPRVNTEEERAKARALEEMLWLRLQEELQADPDCPGK
jgi:hypothetical protein